MGNRLVYLNFVKKQSINHLVLCTKS